MAWRRGQALGQDLRDRVLADAGRPARAVAARFGVSASYVVKARARLRDAGEASARPQRNRVHMMYAKDGKSLQKAGAKELLESALRMRPDRILLQELRDGTAFFYLRNVNSGHPGSITTVHANTAEGALEQLTLLVKESEGGNDLDRHDIRALLRALVDIVVQMDRLPPGDGQPARYLMTEVWFDPAGKPRD